MPTFEVVLRPTEARMTGALGPYRSYVEWMMFGFDVPRRGDIIRVDNELIRLDYFGHVQRGYAGSLPGQHKAGAVTTIVGVQLEVERAGR